MAKFYVTTSIVYINNRPALHYLYELVAADVLARYHRMIGDDTFFLTGTDEHSQNVERRAREEGLSTRAFSDQMAAEYREVEARFGIAYDRFIRTEDPDHVQGVRELIARLQSRGDIHKGMYKGWYCVSCEAFRDQSELVDGFCPVHPTLKATYIEEENYFFALSRYQERLAEHIARHPQFIQPETRRNEVLGWLKAGLRDFSISRSSVRWGIPFPGDERHVVYVWGDALVNYITGVGYGTDEAGFKRWWPADLHIIGKDISRFHCLYWPAMLMAADLPLPKRVWVHGFMLYGGERMSKTRGNFIDPIEAAEEFGIDGVRYLVLREVPFDRDGDISWESMTDRFNADLANDLGNFVFRSLSMLQRYFDGRVPVPEPEATALDRQLRTAYERAVKGLGKSLKELDYAGALALIWAAVNRGNKYIEQTAPWVLATKSDQRKRLATVMYNLTEAIRLTAYLVFPFMPESGTKIAAQVKADLKTPWEAAQAWGQLQPRTQTTLGEVMFPRLVKQELVR